MSDARATNTHMRRALFFACVLVLGGCERFTNLISSGPADGDGGRDGGRDAGGSVDSGVADSGPRLDSGPPAVISDAGIVFCGDVPCVCSNGKDDDGDGEIDGFDAECTGPYDQDEATFSTGEVKEGNPRCNDCFFDGNPSSNDDGCRVAVSCASNGTASSGKGACDSCEPSLECVNNCLPRTPNGCDCFGCCEVQLGTGTLRVLLADTCSLGDLADPTKCPTCILSSRCENPCGRCELCPGKTPADLPSDCRTPDGLGYACDDADVCGPSRPCSGLSYCSQGCCVPIVL
jgi:hypothetical protein